MEPRRLGRSEIRVSALGLGCWAIGGPWTMNGNPAGWGIVDDAESIRALQRGLELGVTLFDTAANYGAGHSERILGRALAGKRDRVVIATKFGYVVDQANRHVVSDDGAVVRNLRADCENSLRRLGTEYIDLYQFHVGAFPPDSAAPVRDALEELAAEGKIRWYGWSTDNAQGARVFAQGKHCTAIQVNLNLVQDAPDVLAVCDEYDLAAIVRGPLGRGLLTGKYAADAAFPANDVRSTPGFSSRIPTLVAGLDRVRDVLNASGRTLSQGALAWTWARSPRTIPIPGIRTVAQVEDDAGALSFGPLDAGQMQTIERLLGR